MAKIQIKKVVHMLDAKFSPSCWKYVLTQHTRGGINAKNSIVHLCLFVDKKNLRWRKGGRFWFV